MRKLLFLSAVLVLWAVKNTYGQNCTPTNNNPAIGVPYSYEVNVSSPYTEGTYQWYVTQDTDLLSGDIIQKDNNYFSLKEGSGNSTYNATTGTTKKLSLTWKSDALATTNPFYLVLKYTGNNGTCDAMNMKAMKIQPLNTFKLSIEPVSDENGSAFTGDAKVCVADITSAKIENDKVKYVYGKNTLYYKVTAKGFVGKWKPTIALPALQGKQDKGRKYESIQWKQGTGVFADFKTFTASGEAQTLVAETDATISDADSGSSFILKVVIDNGTYEGLEDENINLETKGNIVLSNGNTSNLRDVDDDCSELSSDKKASQIILKRPTIEATSGEFIIQM